MTAKPTLPQIFTFQKNPTCWEDVFFDSHAHIQYPEFPDKNLIINNAKSVKLQGIVCVGTELTTSQQAYDLSTTFPDYVFPTAGNHPYNADQDFEPIYNFCHLHKPKIIGIGETGLDYFKNPIDRQTQLNSFLNHATLAKQLDLPVIIHLREVDQCWDDCWNTLKKAKYPKAIFHCFTGNLKQAEQIWSHNYKTSFSLLVTYPKNQYLSEIYQKCPLSNLLIETDSPYLPPQARRAQTNQPMYLNSIKGLAE